MDATYQLTALFAKLESMHIALGKWRTSPESKLQRGVRGAPGNLRRSVKHFILEMLSSLRTSIRALDLLRLLRKDAKTIC